ncbi:18078_t:CDS:2 [Dentiscutata erythropus]|uniref:18078_t:CDS:1 n=1 Tax=Dentiscutata erythropus TaxID=1348616 RepID=A0A9N9G8K5_9GLOM|nr:18078_t:CDS:2 [Dentiscutata erythropus]
MCENNIFTNIFTHHMSLSEHFQSGSRISTVVKTASGDNKPDEVVEAESESNEPVNDMKIAMAFASY